MEHKTLNQIRNVAFILADAPRARPMSRRQRFERWAEALEREGGRRLRTLREIEYAPREEREALRADDSPLTVAYTDPRLRADGLAGDTMGDAVAYFGVSRMELHGILCTCFHGATIPADAASIFKVLCDPQGHVAIDSSGMLQAATGEPVAAVGDTFVVHMDREALNDYPLGRYDVTVTITTFVLSSLSATVAGVLLVGYAGVHPSVGRGYEFIAITAVVLGGVVLGGGRGWVVGAVAGAFALEALFTLLNFAGVPSTYRDAVQGAIIILAVAYSASTFGARRPRRA